jgi:hypothetical protein
LARVKDNTPMRAGKARATGFDRLIRKGVGHRPTIIGLVTAVLLTGIRNTASFFWMDRQRPFLFVPGLTSSMLVLADNGDDFLRDSK